MTSLDQTAFDDSSREPSSADRGGLDVEAATAANLLTALAARLRAAYERGADISELAAASHQSTAEVRRLLQRAGVNVPADDQRWVDGPGRGDGRSWADEQGRVNEQGRAGALKPPGRPAHDSQQPRPVRRPTPSRRLSRLHPRTEATPTDPPAPSAPSAPATPPEPLPTQPGARQPVPPPPSQTPMGILIGASPTYSEPPAQPEDRHPRRVPARVVRVGRGTSLVVLPSWRAAIAVSVPTDLLVRATGLSADRLAGAQLSALMNPDALHDRELDLHDWQSEP
ncbi:hypothetical protein [Kitasatospora sp. MAP5-34]|uniref:hypothetical protein n=1 Tax=Kitasatospora sp. MAP5-34 TaxID=3035102 RepID=UPI002475D609|nr:hypothetical protein [Kitasatospora sp. MAP5-34]MDH6578787.1 hypothetical protein [Kitasatospora sp. MAP5-34]